MSKKGVREERAAGDEADSPWLLDDKYAAAAVVRNLEVEWIPQATDKRRKGQSRSTCDRRRSIRRTTAPASTHYNDQQHNNVPQQETTPRDHVLLAYPRLRILGGGAGGSWVNQDFGWSSALALHALLPNHAGFSPWRRHCTVFGVTETSRQSSFFLLHLYHRNLRKSLLESRRTQLGAHAPHYIFRHHSLAALIALKANFQGNVEEHSLRVVAIVLRQLDPALALMRREVGRVHVI